MTVEPATDDGAWRGLAANADGDGLCVKMAWRGAIDAMVFNVLCTVEWVVEIQGLSCWMLSWHASMFYIIQGLAYCCVNTAMF